MKSIDLFCASPASTAICSSMDHRSIIRHGMRSIDRQIHRLGETPRSRANAPPCSSHLPFDPSYHNTRKSSSAKPTETFRRKSCADADDLASPPSSSRYLLTDHNKLFFDFVSDSDGALVSSQPLIKDNNKYKRLNSGGFPAFRSLSTRSYESPVYNPSSTGLQVHKNSSGKLSDHLNAQKSSSPPSNRQAVELRVSIHCKGCEEKLRKHISRMEGVTSFSIDLATKKVTVIGNVTPLGVLTSISKVKNAQFWPSPTSTSSSSSSSSPRVSLTRP